MHGIQISNSKIAVINAYKIMERLPLSLFVFFTDIVMSTCVENFEKQFEKNVLRILCDY